MRCGVEKFDKGCSSPPMAMASRELGMELLPLTMGGRVTSSRATHALASLEDETPPRRGARLSRPTHDADSWRLSHRRRIFHSSLNFLKPSRSIALFHLFLSDLPQRMYNTRFSALHSQKPQHPQQLRLITRFQQQQKASIVGTSPSSNSNV